MSENLLTWTCPQCGKVITSLYQRQLDQNKKAHLDACVQPVTCKHLETKKPSTVAFEGAALPLSACLFIVGWVSYYFGEKKTLATNLSRKAEASK
jgi:hypothetical protein